MDVFAYDFMISAPDDERDIAIARRLAASIAKYRLPKSIRKGAVSHRRYAEDFSESIEDAALAALDTCRFFVLICTPRTKPSEAIGKRLSYLASVGRKSAVIAVLVEGEPIDAFPEQFIEQKIVKKIRADGSIEEITETLEPVASDLRARTRRGFSHALAYETVRITASLIGMHPDALERRHEKRRRKRLLAMALAIGTISTVTASVFLGFGLTAKHEGDVAKLQTAAGAEMVDRLLVQLPERFAPVESSLPYLEDAMLSSVEGLYNRGSANISMVDIEQVLAIGTRDDPSSIIRKASMWRRFGNEKTARELYRQGIDSVGFDASVSDRFLDAVELVHMPGLCPGYGMYVFAENGVSGIIEGDIIISLNGDTFTRYNDFYDTLDEAVPGTVFDVGLLVRPGGDPPLPRGNVTLSREALFMLDAAGI